MKQCSIDDCFKKVHKRGWCSTHYARWRRRGTTDPPTAKQKEEAAAARRIAWQHKPKRVPACGHPQRKHCARGMCGSCHAIYSRRLKPRCAIAECGKAINTGPLCGMHALRLARHGTTDDLPRGRSSEFLTSVRPRKEPTKVICGHPDRRHMAKGLCQPCYTGKWLKEHPHVNSGTTWLRNNPDKARAHRRRAALKKHGITLQDYEDLWQKQSGRCANSRCSRSCPVIVSDYREGLQVDHDHRTGQIRGLLCARCNTALGHVDDDKFRLLGLIEYLGVNGLDLSTAKVA